MSKKVEHNSKNAVIVRLNLGEMEFLANEVATSMVGVTDCIEALEVTFKGVTEFRSQSG